MKKIHYVLSGVGVLVFAAALIAAARPASRPEAAEEKAAPVDVRTVTAVEETLGVPFDIGGDVRARDTAAIVSRIVAEIRQVRVKPGDRVRDGEPLVILDARDLVAARARADASIIAAEQSAQLATAERQAAEASLTLATAMHRRIAGLRQKNSATASEMDEAEAGLQAAQARLKSAEAGVAGAVASIQVAKASAQAAKVSESYATLTAPFDGMVTQKMAEVGNMASPGVPLLTVEDTGAFRLEVRVDESRAPLVGLGQAVDVLLDGLTVPVPGRVVEMSRTLDPIAHAFLAKIELPSATGLRSGMYGRARIPGPARRLLAVPEGGVVRRGQLTSVFVVDRSGKAHLRLVTLGESTAGRVEVRAGLDPGETIVVDPPPTLVDGRVVRTAERR